VRKERAAGLYERATIISPDLAEQDNFRKALNMVCREGKAKEIISRAAEKKRVLDNIEAISRGTKTLDSVLRNFESQSIALLPDTRFVRGSDLASRLDSSRASLDNIQADARLDQRPQGVSSIRR